MIVHTVVEWLLVLAFAGAGLYNASGTPAAQNSFTNWGYPRWWCYVTGALEITAAALIALPVTHPAGLLLGALIIIVAAATVVRRRDYAHLPPLLIFIVLLAVGMVGLSR